MHPPHSIGILTFAFALWFRMYYGRITVDKGSVGLVVGRITVHKEMFYINRDK